MKNDVRLSQFVLPEKYELLLKPDLEAFTFEGEETIELNLLKPTAEITLHSAELEIESAEFIESEEKVWAGKISFNEKRETATFKFPKPLKKGQAKLKLIFKGILNDKMRGFYRSKFQHDGKNKYMATTQFESTDARRAFPCFDEPDKKAVFEVSLIVPKGLTVVSNTIESHIKEHDLKKNLVHVAFEPSPKMSSYLLAFIVGDFEKIQKRTRNNTLVRVFVTPGKKHQAKFALDVAVRCLEFYEDYFEIPYPLPTADLIAIPDFSAGAMENWGAVTYRETAILVDPDISASAAKQRVALVIAHELAHQWFGNLVTMNWWTHLWLNEGFASYIEYLAVNELFPQWDIWTQFLIDEHNRALELDGLASTHPIEVEVHHPDEISEIFDAVSYSKGASILRMLAEYLGEEKFRDGLRHYLKTHSYANASTDDLWKSLEIISKRDVKKIMQNWTSKPGYPLISLIERPKNLELKQSRFFASPASRKKNQGKTVWSIPLKVTNDKLQETSYLVDKINLLIPKTDGWVKVNAGEVSLLRVDYPPLLLEKFADPISNKSLGAVDRLAIVRDAFDLAEAGLLKTQETLRLSSSYEQEDDYSVWVELASGLLKIDELIAQENYYENFRKLGREIYKPISEKLGWSEKKTESHTKTLLRSLVLSQLGSFGDEETIKMAQELFKLSLKGTKSLNANLRGLVYKLVAENGGEKEYAQLLKLHAKANLQEEQNRILRSLGAFKDKKLLQKTLEFSLSSKVRPQDAFLVVNFVWANPLGTELAWEFTKKNWKALVEKFAGGGHLLPRFIQPAARFNKVSQLNDFKNFFKKNSAPGAKRTIEQVIEKIESNIDWLKRDGKGIEKFLK